MHCVGSQPGRCWTNCAPRTLYSSAFWWCAKSHSAEFLCGLKGSGRCRRTRLVAKANGRHNSVRYGRLSPECQTENTRHQAAFRLEPLTQHAQGPRPRRPALAQLLACKTKTTSVLNIRASTACTLWPTGPAMMPKCHDPGILRILAARDTRHVELLVGGVEVALDHRIGVVRIQSRRDDAAPATPNRVSSEWLPQFAVIKMSGSRSRTETRHGVCSR